MRAFLAQRALIFWPNDGSFSLHEHFDDAKSICQALLHYHKLAKAEAPALRSPLAVPCVPPTLRGAQVHAAQTILNNCVTVLEGYPGTGKTAIITWAMSYFANVLLVTLTGAMASSLRDRNGGRPEAACTIDHIIWNAFQMAPAIAYAWLSRYQVLIIDEFSNVTTTKLARLLLLLPNLRRVIFVGDHQQIRSRKAGDPLGDLRDHFPLFELREILRVAPHLQALLEVPKVLSEQSVKLLRWSPAGPLTMVEPVKDSIDADKALLKALLNDVWASGGRRLMHFQLIVLQNDRRCVLNAHCHELAIEAGIISRKAQRVMMGGPNKDIGYCVGAKICFTHNYNKPVEWCENESEAAAATSWRQDKWHGDPVVNGECGVIVSITTLPQRKGWSLCFTINDEKMRDTRHQKTVIISRSIANAVSPNHMDLGYAITTTKVQGREYPYAIFWNNRGSMASNGYWSRAHPYVALTRGKEHVWYVGYKRDLWAMCDYAEPHRRTILRAMLEGHFAAQYRAVGPVVSAGELHPAGTVYTTLPKGVACVPTLADVLRERELQQREERKQRAIQEAMEAAAMEMDEDDE